MSRRTFNVIDIDYDVHEVWYVTCDAENVIRKMVFNTTELEQWMIVNGHDQHPAYTFSEKWIAGATIRDAVLIAFLKHMMPEYSFLLEKTTSL